MASGASPSPSAIFSSLFESTPLSTPLPPGVEPVYDIDAVPVDDSGRRRAGHTAPHKLKAAITLQQHGMDGRQPGAAAPDGNLYFRRQQSLHSQHRQSPEQQSGRQRQTLQPSTYSRSSSVPAATSQASSSSGPLRIVVAATSTIRPGLPRRSSLLSSSTTIDSSSAGESSSSSSSDNAAPSSPPARRISDRNATDARPSERTTAQRIDRTSPSSVSTYSSTWSAGATTPRSCLTASTPGSSLTTSSTRSSTFTHFDLWGGSSGLNGPGSSSSPTTGYTAAYAYTALPAHRDQHGGGTGTVQRPQLPSGFHPASVAGGPAGGSTLLVGGARPMLLRSASEDVHTRRQNRVHFALPPSREEELQDERVLCPDGAHQDGLSDADLSMKARALTAGAIPAPHAYPFPVRQGAPAAPHPTPLRGLGFALAAPTRSPRSAHSALSSPAAIAKQDGPSALTISLKSADLLKDAPWSAEPECNANSTDVYTASLTAPESMEGAILRSRTMSSPAVANSHYSPSADGSRRLSALRGSFDTATAEAIRRATVSVRNAASSASPPAVQLDIGNRSGCASTEPSFAKTQLASEDAISGGQDAVSSAPGPESGLMGTWADGYFGKAIRNKALDLICKSLPGIRKDGDRSPVTIVEYGCSNSFSASLVAPILQQMQALEYGGSGSVPGTFSVVHADILGADFRHINKELDFPASGAIYTHPSAPWRDVIFPSFVSRPFAAQVVPPQTVDLGFSLMDLHWRKASSTSAVDTVASIRSAKAAGPGPTVSSAIAAQADLQNFLLTRAKEFKRDGILVAAFLQGSEPVEKVAAALAAVKTGRAVPMWDEGSDADADAPHFTSPLRHDVQLAHCKPATSPRVSSTTPPAGIIFSGMPSSSSLGRELSMRSPATLASDILSPASSTMARTRSGSSPCNPVYSSPNPDRHPDIWSAMPNLLAPCIQRLVSTGMVKSDTAHRLLALPMHPRTSRQTRAALHAVRELWTIEWSCGLPDGTASLSPLIGSDALVETDDAVVETVQEAPLHLVHPAYAAFQDSLISRSQYAEHALRFIRVLYEAHFRTVLREQAKLNSGKVEETLNALLEVIREKLEESGRPALPIELECCISVLKRR